MLVSMLRRCMFSKKRREVQGRSFAEQSPVIVWEAYSVGDEEGNTCPEI
jgi:hypothetical protein